MGPVALSVRTANAIGRLAKTGTRRIICLYGVQFEVYLEQRTTKYTSSRIIIMHLVSFFILEDVLSVQSHYPLGLIMRFLV